jgi:hypothetical protein
MAGRMVVLERGRCTFLEKARAGHAVGARVLAVASSEDKAESPSAGLGVDKDTGEEAVSAVKDLAMVLTMLYASSFFLYSSSLYALQHAWPAVTHRVAWHWVCYLLLLLLLPLLLLLDTIIRFLSRTPH